MNELVNDNWFISIVSSLITLVIVPVTTFMVNTIRARTGVFSGTYIAITTMRYSKERIIELVECKHIKNRVSGKIYGVAIILNETPEKIVQSNNKYSFNGSISERLLVVSYYSADKADLSAGSLTLHGNTTGTAFSGIWGGLEGGEIISSGCIWIKSNKKLIWKKDYDTIMSQVQLHSLGVIIGDNVSGKSFGKGFSFLTNI